MVQYGFLPKSERSLVKLKIQGFKFRISPMPQHAQGALWAGKSSPQDVREAARIMTVFLNLLYLSFWLSI